MGTVRRLSNSIMSALLAEPEADAALIVGSGASDQDLPLAGDYVGLGGPDAVPLETQGAFEIEPGQQQQHQLDDKGQYGLLDDLFLKPDPSQISSVRRALRIRNIAETKSKLKWTTFFHLTLGALMLAKLLPEILDKLDIFVMEVEELFLPKPLIWEWMWIGSVVGTLFSWMASKKSNILQMRIFQITTLVLGVLPILIGMGVHFSDAYAFISEDKKTKILKWMGLPVAMLWYGFFLLALQAHSMQLYFSNVLVAAWQPKRKLK